MTYRIGIDAGSKTLKLVVLDEAGTVVYDAYMRHRANIARTLGEAIHDLNWRHGPVDASIAMTGSAAIEVARVLGIPFVQEVVATTHAVRTLEPDADVVIELGGEDAKIIYLDERPEQRMNATCAGGTGGFIDTIAYMLDMRSSQMSQLAFGASRSYPIASRCAVFAQTDVRRCSTPARARPISPRASSTPSCARRCRGLPAGVPSAATSSSWAVRSSTCRTSSMRFAGRSGFRHAMASSRRTRICSPSRVRRCSRMTRGDSAAIPSS